MAIHHNSVSPHALAIWRKLTLSDLDTLIACSMFSKPRVTSHTPRATPLDLPRLDALNLIYLDDDGRWETTPDGEEVLFAGSKVE